MKQSSGALVIRAWVEAGATTGLRARITESRDLYADDTIVTTAGTVEEVLDSVRSWLESLLEDSDPT